MEGPDKGSRLDGDAAASPRNAKGRPDRRAEALRANLQRRKAQSRERAAESRDGKPPADEPAG